MSKVSIFEKIIPNSLSSYKDRSHKHLTDTATDVMHPSSIYIIPRCIYKHLNKYNGSIISNVENYLSYEDTAFLLAINHKLNYSHIATIYNNLSEVYKTNVDFMIKTDSLIKSVDNYLNTSENIDENNLYNIMNIENNIFIIINEGFYNRLNNKEFKLEFLKNLCSMCFNVMGDGKTTAQPFFKEFVDVL